MPLNTSSTLASWLSREIEHGRHLDVDAAVLQLLHLTDKLDDAAPGAGIAHVLFGDGGDALGVDAVRVDVGAIGQRGQNADFPAGVDALHVGGGVPLGVAQLLGQF